jgi:hypothetical protein
MPTWMPPIPPSATVTMAVNDPPRPAATAVVAPAPDAL